MCGRAGFVFLGSFLFHRTTGLIPAFCGRSLHGERGVYHGFMVFYLRFFRFYFYIFSLLFLVLLSKLVHSFALVSSSASAFACMVRRRLLSTIIIDLIAWAAFFWGEVRVYR